MIPPARSRGSRLLTLRLCLRLLKPCKVQTVYQFDGCRWRERQAMGDLDNGLLALCWRLIRFFELWRNLGDDVWLKAAYRGGCQACQNLPKGAIRHAERYHCHSLPSA